MTADLRTALLARRGALLASGTVIGQIVALASIPLVSRLFLPAAYGHYAVFAAIAGVGGSVAALRFHLAIPLADSTASARGVAVLGLASSAAVGVGIAIVVPLALPRFAPDLVAQPLWLAGVSVCLVGALHVFTQVSLQSQLDRRILVSRIIASGGVNVVPVPLALLVGGTAAALMAGHVFAQMLAVMVLAGSLHYLEGVPRQAVRRLAARYRKFPLLSTPSALLHSTSIQSMPIVLASAFDPSVAGMAAMSMRLVHAPATLVGQSVGQVFYTTAAISGSIERQNVTRRLVQGGLAFGVPIAVVIVGTATAVVVPVLGSQWAGMASYLVAMAPWAPIMMANAPLTFVPSLVERQGVDFGHQSVLLALRAGALMVGVWLDSPTVAVGAFIGVSFVEGLLYGAYTFRLLGMKASGYLGVWGSEVLATLPTAVVLILFRVAGVPALALITVAGLLLAAHVVRGARMLMRGHE